MLPPRLESLSLQGFACLDADALADLGAACPALAHLRLLHCGASGSSGVLHALVRALPRLATLVAKDGSSPYGGASRSGLAAVASLSCLTALALAIEPGTDVAALAELTDLRCALERGADSGTPMLDYRTWGMHAAACRHNSLTSRATGVGWPRPPLARYLLLDGRSNAEVTGLAALGRLTALRALVLPLLGLATGNRAGLAALEAALPHALIANVSRAAGQTWGPQWWRAFSMREREWWREPEVPWAWHPMLSVAP
jgi:hypothetical protein